MIRLDARDLVCIRGGREVFAGVGFTISASEALLVTGPNGAGKSSLLRMIAGRVRVAAGQLSLTGAAPDRPLAEQVHYLGHQDALKPALTVMENLRFWTDYLGGGDPASALASVGLGGLAHLPAGYLSAGQRRRLSLARLVAVSRPIWLLDEATAALDSAAQQRLTELMRGHLAAGGLIVAATHGPIGLERAKELQLGQTASLASGGPQ